MFELNSNDYERVRPLFRKMDIHLPLQAILAGNVEAPIFVDNPRHPQTAITWTGHRIYMAGSPGSTELIDAVRKIFLEKFAMPAWKAGIDSYVMYFSTEKWEVFIQAMLRQKYPIRSSRQYLKIRSRNSQKSELPKGLVIREVDQRLLSDGWQNLDYLTDEMCSERPTVEDFLNKSFGVCLTKDNEILGWCLSEYNTGHRCEVGIAIREDYRRQGLATMIAKAFIDQAYQRDVAQIGWHCLSTNIGSVRTALKAGFEQTEEYPVYFGWFDDAYNLAMNGYYAHGKEQYAEALGYYEKALKLGDFPDWVYWGLACDAALIGEKEKAINYLKEAVENGFNDLEQLQTSKYLQNLHDMGEWQEILQKLG